MGRLDFEEGRNYQSVSISGEKVKGSHFAVGVNAERFSKWDAPIIDGRQAERNLFPQKCHVWQLHVEFEIRPHFNQPPLKSRSPCVKRVKEV